MNFNTSNVKVLQAVYIDLDYYKNNFNTSNVKVLPDEEAFKEAYK